MTTGPSSSPSSPPRNAPRNDARVPPVVLAFASGLGTGFIPPSGTVASLGALVLYWFIPAFEAWPVHAGIVAIAFALGIPAAGRMEKKYGPDPSQVVIDEFVGMWLSLLLLPRTPAIAVVSFFLFRLLDIVKPQPARMFDRMRGGAGIMLDDVVAGVYANLLLQFAVRIAPHSFLLSPSIFVR